MNKSKFKVGDYVAYKPNALVFTSTIFRGRIVNVIPDYDKDGILFWKYEVLYITGLSAIEIEQDLEKIDWLLESL